MTDLLLSLLVPGVVLLAIAIDIGWLLGRWR
jgi:hypothetical protein